MAGVALGDIHLRFAWEAWRFSDIHAFTLRDRRGTYGTALALVARLGPAGCGGTLRGRRRTWRHPPSFCVAGVALMALRCLWWRAWLACVTANCVQAMFGHVLLAHNVLLYLLAVLHRRLHRPHDCCFVTWLSIYGLVALARRGKRPCACLIGTLWKRCWHVSACLIET